MTKPLPFNKIEPMGKEIDMALTHDADGVTVTGNPVKGEDLKSVAEQLGFADGGGMRFNDDKTRMELVPIEWEWALADVTTQGSKKYEIRNWERGMDWSIMVGCAKRHLAKFLAGEQYDGPEFSIEKGTTGCHHLAMAAWNLLALMSYDLRGIGNNDLPKYHGDILSLVNAIGIIGIEKPSEKPPGIDEIMENLNMSRRRDDGAKVDMSDKSISGLS